MPHACYTLQSCGLPLGHHHPVRYVMIESVVSYCNAQYRRLRVIASLCFVVAFGVTDSALAQKDDAQSSGRGRTEVGNVPWDPSTLTGDKVIHGVDDRIDVYEETDSFRVDLSNSVCALMPDFRVSDNGDGTSTILAAQYTQFGDPACAEEPFGDQPTAAFCTGFLVGEDLIATAGHCFDEADIPITRFVFGWVMEDATTAATVIPDSQIYTAVEIVGRELIGSEFDWAVLRVDRPVVVPGALPLEIRRSGTVPLGAQVGVIGHPSGLPMKIAFGDETVVVFNSAPGFFAANLDTYAGNSGSPVFNATTGVVEGILVRGAPDYVDTGSCFVSDVLADNEGGESATKTTVFDEFVDEVVTSRGTVRFDKTTYACPDVVEVTLRDSDLAGAVGITITTSGGDVEDLFLNETVPGLGVFRATIQIGEGGANPQNGQLNVVDGQSISTQYNDADDGSGSSATVNALAAVDCTAPVIFNVTITNVSSSWATVNFTTNEPALGQIQVGTDCGVVDSTFTGTTTGTDHSVLVRNLDLSTQYFITVEAIDDAGNTGSDDNIGACYTFTTANRGVYYTQFFGDPPHDLNNSTISLLPIDAHPFYAMCVRPATSYPTNPALGTTLSLADDSSELVTIGASETVSLYGIDYSEFHVGSNGYITFDGPDITFAESVPAHFDRQRISGLFVDLDPSSGGRVTSLELSDRIAITYRDVSQFGTANSNNFQIELFFDGRIDITYLNVDSTIGLVGLSQGFGVASDYGPMDLSAGITCGANINDFDGDGILNIIEGTGDPDRDGSPNLADLDSDADGIPDAEEGTDDVDGDGIPNFLDTDSDADGVSDSDEVAFGFDPYNKEAFPDLPLAFWSVLALMLAVSGIAALRYAGKATP